MLNALRRSCCRGLLYRDLGAQQSFKSTWVLDDELMAWQERTPSIVQKYGGTSLGTTAKLTKVLGIVKEWHSKQPLTLVVSAISRFYILCSMFLPLLVKTHALLV